MSEDNIMLDLKDNLLKRIDESFFFVVDADGQQRLDKLLADCRAEIERLPKPYVPMTDDEWREYFDDDMSGLSYNFYREIEAHIIKRAGLEIKHD